MSDIFKNNAGKLGSIPVDSPGVLGISGGDSLDIIVTDISGSLSDGYQAMKSFGNDVFVTLFGPALTLYTLTCADGTLSCSSSKGSVTKLGELYKKNRIAADGRPVLTITVADLTIKGFLVGVTFGVADKKLSYQLQILGQVVI